jgi:hypothetical protein
MSEKNPVEEFLGMRKTANVVGEAFRRFPQHLAHAGAAAGAAATVGLVGAGIHGAVSKIVDVATKSHDFRQMMHANEDLHPHYESDPKRFNLMFNTLRTMNPSYSKDPLVAGSFMRRMIESPTGLGGIAGEALQHRGDFPESAFGVAHDYAREGAKAGLGESLRAQSQEAAFQQKETHHQEQMDLQRQQQANMGRPTEESSEEHMFDPESGGWKQTKSVRKQTRRV